MFNINAYICLCNCKAAPVRVASERSKETVLHSRGHGTRAKALATGRVHSELAKPTRVNWTCQSPCDEMNSTFRMSLDFRTVTRGNVAEGTRLHVTGHAPCDQVKSTFGLSKEVCGGTFQIQMYTSVAFRRMYVSRRYISRYQM